MGSLEERVAYIEGRMDDHTALMSELRAEVRELRAEMRGFRSDVDRRFERVAHKIDRQFTWLVGLLVGVLGALAGLAIQLARLQV